ncbi:MAG: 5-(carboxyamino)imidazole ribonucleotide mutase, partial [Castellaniella sp.]
LAMTDAALLQKLQDYRARQTGVARAMAVPPEAS